MSTPWGTRLLAVAFALALAPAVVVSQDDPEVQVQNDASSGGDAGNTRLAATRVTPFGTYSAHLAGSSQGDPEDWFKFAVALGAPINIEVRIFQTGVLLPGDYGMYRTQAQLQDPNGVLLDTPLSNPGDSRVAFVAAPLAGDYYLRIHGQNGFRGNYEFCFATGTYACPPNPMGVYGQGTLSDGSPRNKVVRVLLVPPVHGDLGNPLGPTALDYLDATLEGIHEWERAIDLFVAKYPTYAYLDQVDVQIELFDLQAPAGVRYDVDIVYVPTGSHIFRGFASTGSDSTPILADRHIALSTFSASPRAGQLVADYPEYNDLHAVTMHEFAHTFGLSHTATWTSQYGPDLMNSPATFVYGDGLPVYDGGERTPRQCVSSLNLYVLAQTFAWIPDGSWRSIRGWWNLPSSIPYELFCAPSA